MTETPRAIRGMSDILPKSTWLWQHVESILQQQAKVFAYQEIRTPIAEFAALFERSVGASTDIIEKEMYVFEDRKGERIALRPEGTASVVRAAIRSGCLRSGVHRFWYQGPMFRYERPQKGRQRQFHQFGIEVYGLTGYLVEAELIQFSDGLWTALGIQDQIGLQINHLGDTEARKRYKAALVDYLKQHQAHLDDDSARRLTTNPLRILDSKVPETIAILNNAPKLSDYLSADDQAEFSQLKNTLDTLEIAYTVNERLVRGLDYYTGFVFEWVSSALGAQSAVCAGGRYDGLVAELGGPETPAIGFAIGLERLVEIVRQNDTAPIVNPSVLILPIAQSDEVGPTALVLAARLRAALPAQTISVALKPGRVGAIFKRAANSGAQFAVVLGDDELSGESYTLKDLFQGEQVTYLSFNQLIGAISGA